MRLERLILTGLSDAFPGVVDLPLRDLGDGVVAIVGPNGEGKTTILEATPGAVYRKLPSRDDVDPVEYAKGRDSSIDLTFRFDGVGLFRSRLNLDGPKRKSDAVLEEVLADGRRVPLNDGKVSTYDAAVRERFPSFELFINSSYAAQGRGDEFTQTKPTARKDLFAEFLNLKRLLDLAKTATAAADLVNDVRLRLEVQTEQLARDTAPTLAEDLDRQMAALDVTSRDADVRQQALRARLASLEASAAIAQEQVTAYAAAMERIAALKWDFATVSTKREELARQRVTALVTLNAEQTRIAAKRDADVTDATTKIAGNETIQTQADAIRAAVAAIAAIDDVQPKARQALANRQAAQQVIARRLREVERQLAALVPVEQDLTRATTDARLLGAVPCGGAGEFASCQFLVNATEAQGRIPALEEQLGPKVALADQVAALRREEDGHGVEIDTLKASVAARETARTGHQRLAAYAEPLAVAEARIVELTRARDAAERDADEQRIAARTRYDARVEDLDADGLALTVAEDRLRQELRTATAARDASEAGNQQAAILQADLTTVRAQWDVNTSTIATVANGRQEIERRRQDLAAKRARLVEVRDRLARVQQELLEWRDLAKALGKGGLPDLEIDAAGPTITATTNQLLSACFGPRFTLELVTQVAKADGDGLKDLFTVLVLDNEAPARGWKDLKYLSGGQKVVVQEALMCAIACYVNDRAPLPIRTLWRDETGAALDPENAVRYVQMLRKVRELGGFAHVFFITHNTEAAALADAQIRVGGGRAVIVYQPFAEAA